MIRKSVCVFIGTVLAMGIALGSETAPADLENSLIHVVVAFQRHDAGLPWRKQQPALRRGYAVMVSDRYAITTENLVRNHTLVEVQRARRGEKIEARVVMADPQTNLALLALPTPEPDHWQPLPLAETHNTAARLDVFQFDENSQMQRGSAQIVRLAMTSLPSIAFPALTFTLLTELNINGEGAVVMAGDKVAGIMISYDKDTRTGAMLPYTELSRFFKDATEAPYEGLATPGFSWIPLVDPARRAFLQIQDRMGGVQVAATLPGTGARALLKTHEVSIAIDGYDIDNMGYYEDPDFGRLHLNYLIGGRRKPGDTVSLGLVRDGDDMTITLPLSRYKDEHALIPENTEGEPAEYLVEGGFVFRELSGDYLQSFGNNWVRRLDPKLGNLYFSRRYLPENSGDRVVILSGVLPDAINVGYTQFSNVIIDKINGTPVAHLKDLFEIYDRDGAIERVRLNAMGVDLVLDRGGLSEANQRIAALYRVPSLQFRREQAD